MYYKVYCRSSISGSYTGPYRCKTYREAKNRAVNGEYLIIKHDEETNTDEVVDHIRTEGKQRKDFER